MKCVGLRLLGRDVQQLRVGPDAVQVSQHPLPVLCADLAVDSLGTHLGGFVADLSENLNL